MGESNRKAALAELQRIPGVGQKIAEELWNLGCRSVGDLGGADPEDLYRRLCIQQGAQVDRCVLYVSGWKRDLRFVTVCNDLMEER
jgi:nucleotidyltransferase/DNA polymerase involved in DNA repair